MGLSGERSHSFLSSCFSCDSRMLGFSCLSRGSCASSNAVKAARIRRSGCLSPASSATLQVDTGVKGARTWPHPPQPRPHSLGSCPDLVQRPSPKAQAQLQRFNPSPEAQAPLQGLGPIPLPKHGDGILDGARLDAALLQHATVHIFLQWHLQVALGFLYWSQAAGQVTRGTCRERDTLGKKSKGRMMAGGQKPHLSWEALLGPTYWVVWSCPPETTPLPS